MARPHREKIRPTPNPSPALSAGILAKGGSRSWWLGEEYGARCARKFEDGRGLLPPHPRDIYGQDDETRQAAGGWC